MEWWLRRPNDIRGPWGPKISWHLSYRWEKTLKKPYPGNLSRPGIEPGPAAWQARMLPVAPQRWPGKHVFVYILCLMVKFMYYKLNELLFSICRLSQIFKICSAHSPNFTSLHLRHSSFSNPFVALPASQLILKPFCCFTYVAVHSPTLLLLLLCHKLFT